MFEQITSETKYLLSSAETGFSSPYLYETTLLLLNVNANFGGLTETYNMLLYFKEFSDKRNYICEKRLASGFFLFSLLEMCSRRGVNPEFTTKENFIDDGILRYEANLKSEFILAWTRDHKCSNANCEYVLISDGGMKIHRPVFFGCLGI